MRKINISSALGGNQSCYEYMCYKSAVLNSSVSSLWQCMVLHSRYGAVCR